MPEHPSGPGCIGALLLYLMAVILGAPLLAISSDFWAQHLCIKWQMACGPHLIEYFDK